MGKENNEELSPKPDSDIAPKPTVPDIKISVQGFTNEEAARRLGGELGNMIKIISEHINLAGLDGITVAIDYDDALNTLDRGDKNLSTETRTDTEDHQGVAKSSLVKRDGAIKTHLVFNAGPICPIALEDFTKDQLIDVLQLVAHECGHVEDHMVRDTHYPGVLLQQRIEGYRPNVVAQLSSVFWAEYAACRISSIFCSKSKDQFLTNLQLSLEVIDEKIADAKMTYFGDRDYEKYAETLMEHLALPLKFWAYFIGNHDGLASDAEAYKNEIPSDVDERISDTFIDLTEDLRELWNARTEWESHDDILILGEHFMDLVYSYGVDIEHQEDGTAYISLH